MKLIYFILGLVFFANYSAQTSLDTGLVRNYPFSGNANDISTNSQHGTVYGAALTTDRFGNPNSAYSFDGIDDYIMLNQYDSLLLHQYTYSVWALALSIPTIGTETFVMFTGDPGLGQSISNSNMIGGVYNGWRGHGYNYSLTQSDQYITHSNANVLPNVWQHLVITRSANMLKLYIDGILTSIDSTSYMTNPFYGFPDYMNPTIISGQSYIGGQNYFGTGFFHGKIDDVRIYKRAINATEVNTLYSLTTSSSTGIDFPASQFKLSPNPASDKAQLNYNFTIAKNLVFNISNIQGQILKSEILNSNQGVYKLDLSKFDNGVYFYTIVADGEILSTQKLVVTR